MYEFRSKTDSVIIIVSQFERQLVSIDFSFEESTGCIRCTSVLICRKLKNRVYKFSDSKSLEPNTKVNIGSQINVLYCERKREEANTTD